MKLSMTEREKNAQNPKERSLFKDYQRDCLHQVMEQLKAGKGGSENEEQNQFLTSSGERRGLPVWSSGCASQG